jgi:hypothetical protein
MKMNNAIFIFVISLLISSCSYKHETKYDELREKTIKSIKDENFDNILIVPLSEYRYSILVDQIGDYSKSIENMDIALNKGYKLLLEDINRKQYNCLKEKKFLDNYMFSDWETRNIGFSNWPTRVKAGILLEKIKLLNSKILVIRLLNNRELYPLIEKYQSDLDKTSQNCTD